ncbi:MAG: hypothetical protein M0Q02_12540, partial [Candidatus Muirbacterium halophilum]|nr:hypothetical protein [Candidatus Muirbacterium halophilum]
NGEYFSLVRNDDLKDFYKNYIFDHEQNKIISCDYLCLSILKKIDNDTFLFYSDYLGEIYLFDIKQKKILNKIFIPYIINNVEFNVLNRELIIFPIGSHNIVIYEVI